MQAPRSRCVGCAAAHSVVRPRQAARCPASRCRLEAQCPPRSRCSEIVFDPVMHATSRTPVKWAFTRSHGLSGSGSGGRGRHVGAGGPAPRLAAVWFPPRCRRLPPVGPSLPLPLCRWCPACSRAAPAYTCRRAPVTEFLQPSPKLRPQHGHFSPRRPRPRSRLHRRLLPALARHRPIAERPREPPAGDRFFLPDRRHRRGRRDARGQRDEVLTIFPPQGGGALNARGPSTTRGQLRTPCGILFAAGATVPSCCVNDLVELRSRARSKVRDERGDPWRPAPLIPSFPRKADGPPRPRAGGGRG